jgi:hypothetical protein
MNNKYKAKKLKTRKKPVFLSDTELTDRVKTLSVKYGIDKHNEFVETFFVEKDKNTFSEISIKKLRPVILRDKYLLQYVTDVGRKRHDCYKALISQKSLKNSIDIFSARQRVLFNKLIAIPERFCVHDPSALQRSTSMMRVSSLKFVTKVIHEKVAFDYFRGKFNDMDLSEDLKMLLQGFAVHYDDIIPLWKINTWITRLCPEWLLSNRQALTRLGKISHWPIPLLIEYNNRAESFFSDIACYFTLKFFPIRSNCFSVGAIKHPVPCFMWGANVVFELEDILDSMEMISTTEKFYWEKVLISTYFYEVYGKERYDTISAVYEAGGGNILYESLFKIPKEVEDFLEKISPKPRNEVEELDDDEQLEIDRFNELVGNVSYQEFDPNIDYTFIDIADVPLEARSDDEEQNFINSSEEDLTYVSYDEYAAYDSEAENPETEFSENDRTAQNEEIQFKDHDTYSDAQSDQESVDSNESY